MLASSLALLSASLAGFDSGGASCHARQQPGVVVNATGGLRFRGRELPRSSAAWRCYQRHWRASTPGARAAMLASSLALLSASLAGFDSGGASCHARQQPGVVVNATGGLRFRGRELPCLQQLGVVISAIGGHSGPPNAN
ncbi:hypothetical protein [Candidatus Thalassolituus haligoni]|uniref:hypothetical protein n=1 Tax=Candidatus Thalassolituus haligoni TaxID=3100113 RepID=UPI0035142077